MHGRQNEFQAHSIFSMARKSYSMNLRTHGLVLTRHVTRILDFESHWADGLARVPVVQCFMRARPHGRDAVRNAVAIVKVNENV